MLQFQSRKNVRGRGGEIVPESTPSFGELRIDESGPIQEE
jgi:hypothetical protein